MDLKLVHGSPVLANCAFTSPTMSNLQSKNQLSQADPNFISKIITSAQSSSYNLEMKLQFFRDRAHSFIAREYIIS